MFADSCWLSFAALMIGPVLVVGLEGFGAAARRFRAERA